MECKLRNSVFITLSVFLNDTAYRTGNQEVWYQWNAVARSNWKERRIIFEDIRQIGCEDINRSDLRWGQMLGFVPIDAETSSFTHPAINRR